ncbi:MAG: GGDEF domain-containing protein, partial [Gammaproteobacteria bacterium]
MHRILTRQLKKLDIKDSVIPNVSAWEILLNQVDAYYKAADQDRYTLERSLTISSEEMQVLYKRQKLSYENRLHSIFNAMPDILFLVTEDGKCIEVTSGNKDVLDENRKKSLGKFVHEIYDDDQAYFFNQSIKQAITSDNLVVINYQLTIKGKNRYFEGRIMPSKYEYKDKKTVV